MPNATCSVDGCTKPVKATGWCGMHYERHRRNGHLSVTTVTLADRFWSKVDKDGPLPTYAPFLGPCWVWTAATANQGYGTFFIESGPDHSTVMRGAHRVAYELCVGPIPDGLHLDHFCRVHACVRPDHLEPVTHTENVRRGRAAEVASARQQAKTECVNGHPFDAANTYRNPTSGRRQCRACGRAAQRRYQAKLGLIAA